MPFVLDASVAVAWFVRAQATAYTKRIRVRGKKEPYHVPALWRQEVVNAIWQAWYFGAGLCVPLLDARSRFEPLGNRRYP